MVPVAPAIATPSRSHWRLKLPSPSASAMPETIAVSVESSTALPVIVGSPVGASLMLATGAVAALVSASAVPSPSVQPTRTLIDRPTSASPSWKVVPLAPATAAPSRSHWIVNAPSPSRSAMLPAPTVRTASSTAAPVMTGRPVGASLTGVTVTDATTTWLLKALTPPFTLTSTSVSALPLLRSQARRVRPATLPCQSVAGTKRTRVSASAASSRADASERTPSADQLDPPSTEYCHVPRLSSTPTTAMPASAPGSGSVTRPDSSAETSVPAGPVLSSATGRAH